MDMEEKGKATTTRQHGPAVGGCTGCILIIPQAAREKREERERGGGSGGERKIEPRPISLFPSFSLSPSISLSHRSPYLPSQTSRGASPKCEEIKTGGEQAGRPIASAL